MNLYVISGVTGMTGNELARRLVHSGNRVVGFDNFFASSKLIIKTPILTKVCESGRKHNICIYLFATWI